MCLTAVCWLSLLAHSTSSSILASDPHVGHLVLAWHPPFLSNAAPIEHLDEVERSCQTLQLKYRFFISVIGQSYFVMRDHLLRLNTDYSFLSFFTPMMTRSSSVSWSSVMVFRQVLRAEVKGDLYIAHWWSIRHLCKMFEIRSFKGIGIRMVVGGLVMRLFLTTSCVFYLNFQLMF